jgi:hypothetical protein
VFAENSPYFEREISHVSPYLDNEFILVAIITRQDSKKKFIFKNLTTSRQIWLIPLVDDDSPNPPT